MKAKKVLARILSNPVNVRFGDVQRLAEAFGFRLLRVNGSHHIYGRPDLSEQLNLQEVGGEAKPYQIRQFLKIIERYNLKIKE